MTVQRILAQSLCLALATTVFSAGAQTYQWKDTNGQTIISDAPPPANAKGRRSLGERAPYAPPPADESASASAAAAKTSAEKDLDFRKRQQEAREKSEKQAKDQANDAARRDACDRARRNLTALESDQAIATTDENGQRRVLDAGQRAQEMDRARQNIANACK